MITSPCEIRPREEKKVDPEPMPERFVPASRDDLLRIEASATAQAVHASIDDTAAPVAIPFAGRVIHARPLDTRRFVRAMSRYISLN